MARLTHDQIRRYLQAAVDGRLDSHVQRALDAHLALCAECRAYATELDKLQAVITEAMRERWSSARITHDMVPDVLIRFRRATMRKRIVFSLRSLAGASILLALVILFVGLIRNNALKTSGEPTAPSPVPTSASNGALIAFVRQDFRKANSAEIYVMEADGANPVNLTRNEVNDFNPSWSPDGQRLAFLSERTGRLEAFVMLMPELRPGGIAGVNPDGANVVQVSHDPETGISPNSALSWSPDGKFLVGLVHPPSAPASQLGLIAIFASDGSGQWNIPERPTGTDSLVCPLRDVYSPPQWSPDGRRIAFIGWRHSTEVPFCGHSTNLRSDLFVINSDGSGLMNLSQAGVSEVFAFDWSPGGTQLAYLTFTRLSDFDHRAEINLVNADGSGQRTLREVDAPAYRTFTNLEWSPDRTSLLFAPADWQGTPQRHLYLIDLNSAELTQLPDVVDFPGIIDTVRFLGYSNPGWSPDGKWILYTALGTGPGHVFKLNVADLRVAPDQSKPIQLTFGEETNDGAQWQPGAK